MAFAPSQPATVYAATRGCGVWRSDDSGARVDARNGSNISPLAMALIMSNFDDAEALVAKGARLGSDEKTMVSGVTDPRGKALIQKAMGKG